jgi:hypothetical protein
MNIAEEIKDITPHNTSTTVSILTITDNDPLLMNHADPKHHTPVAQLV